MMNTKNLLDPRGFYLGRIWRPEKSGPSVVTVRDGKIIDITQKGSATVSAILEYPNPVQHLKSLTGEPLGTLEEIMAESEQAKVRIDKRHLLAPIDLQAVKACGVTFAVSMLERVIEERARGDANQAEAIRATIRGIVGDSLKKLKPGSPDAMKVKEVLIREGLWSPYLEVGIGPDAEVFTKAPVLSSVGYGAEIGILENSGWNNPEPEIVLAVDSQGKVKAATLGNDVNLRDIEGRSALLLGKAKDNNASCSLGPFLRLFDETYGIDDVRSAELELTVKGIDGFILSGESSMSEISRDPLDLVSQSHGRHHQYPDGFVLFLGTLFAPSKDRDAPGKGFTHKIGDEVVISEKNLGALRNHVNYSTACPEWTFGIGSLFANLAARNLIS